MLLRDNATLQRAVAHATCISPLDSVIVSSASSFSSSIAVILLLRDDQLVVRDVLSFELDINEALSCCSADESRGGFASSNNDPERSWLPEFIV